MNFSLSMFTVLTTSSSVMVPIIIFFDFLELLLHMVLEAKV